MKSRPIDQLVYETMFPKPKPNDPANFHMLLQRQLVQEVRSETASFYGSLESREAQYPGLDYSYKPHRNRLSRFPWHRRLFRAFDALKLTPSEIAGLTKWEGTRWAKERFEKESGMVIRDTTGDCIQDFVEPELRGPKQVIQEGQEVVVEEMEDIGQEAAMDGMDEDGDESDMEIESVGVELNERLRAAAAQREAGNSTTVMDEEWEQWLKEAAEAGGIPFLAEQGFPLSSSSSRTSGRSTATAMPSRLLNAARLGQWNQIPDFLQNMVRQNIEANNRTALPSSAQQNVQRRRESPIVIPISPESSGLSSGALFNTLHRQSSTPPFRQPRQSITSLSSPVSTSSRISMTRTRQPVASSPLIGSAYSTSTPRWAQQPSASQQPQ
jgi:hypothetical protein